MKCIKWKQSKEQIILPTAVIFEIYLHSSQKEIVWMVSLPLGLEIEKSASAYQSRYIQLNTSKPSSQFRYT